MAEDLFFSFETLTILLPLKDRFVNCLYSSVMSLCLNLTSGSHLPERDCYGKVRLLNQGASKSREVQIKGNKQPNLPLGLVDTA